MIFRLSYHNTTFASWQQTKKAEGFDKREGQLQQQLSALQSEVHLLKETLHTRDALHAKVPPGDRNNLCDLLRRHRVRNAQCDSQQQQ